MKTLLLTALLLVLCRAAVIGIDLGTELMKVECT